MYLLLLRHLLSFATISNLIEWNAITHTFHIPTACDMCMCIMEWKALTICNLHNSQWVSGDRWKANFRLIHPKLYCHVHHVHSLQLNLRSNHRIKEDLRYIFIPWFFFLHEKGYGCSCRDQNWTEGVLQFAFRVGVFSTPLAVVDGCSCDPYKCTVICEVSSSKLASVSC